MPQRRLGASLRGLLQLIRAHNCAGAAVAVIVGARLGAGPAGAPVRSVILAALAVFLSVAASNAYNDARDVSTDRVDKPHRPLPAGRVSHRTAIRLTMVLAAGALIAAWSLDAHSAAIATVGLVVGLLYSYRLKSTALAGNVVVGALSACTIAYGAIAAGRLTAAAVFASGLVFLFVFAREILKAIADREGDALTGVRTIATIARPGLAHRCFAAVAVLFVVAAVLPGLLGMVSPAYVRAMTLSVVVPTVLILVFLEVRPTAGAIALSLRVTKLLWFAGLLSMAMLR